MRPNPVPLTLCIAAAIAAIIAAIIATAAPATPGNDRTNTITPAALRAAVVKKDIPNALAIHRAGGFRGFQPAPGCSLEGDEPVYDFLVQDVAIDNAGNPTGQTPLDAARTRNSRPATPSPTS
jgi:hypothetical protein